MSFAVRATACSSISTARLLAGVFFLRRKIATTAAARSTPSTATSATRAFADGSDTDGTAVVGVLVGARVLSQHPRNTWPPTVGQHCCPAPSPSARHRSCSEQS